MNEPAAVRERTGRPPDDPAWVGLLDDAATFPPGSAPLGEAVPAHHRHRASWYREMVGPFVVTAAGWDALAGLLHADRVLDVALIAPAEGLAIAVDRVLAHPGARLAAVEVPPADLDPVRLRAVVDGAVPDGVAAAVEVPRDGRRRPLLDALAGGAHRVKLRTGGTVAGAFPDARELAEAVLGCRRRGLTVKATAGLHRAVRHDDPATGFAHHGFLNLLAAAAAARTGADTDDLVALLDEQDPARVAARVAALTAPERRGARALFVSFGTCSIAEPVDDLVGLGLLAPPTHPTHPTGGDATMTWLDLPPHTPFGPDNLPYGVFSEPGDDRRRVGVAVGDDVLDLTTAAADLGAPFAALVTGPTLDPLLAAGRPTWRQVRATVRDWLVDPGHAAAVRPHLRPRAGVVLHLPFTVGDYVDFYSSEHHARNAGAIFRPDAEPLTPNWKHLPIGYHGRSGSVVVSGTPIVRPRGQRKGAHDPEPVFGPSVRLDIEAEVGFVVGTGSALGTAVPVADFAEHVFGVFLLNDWSARDLQAWEYVPLGPFLGKSFATSISPWIVPLDALDAAWVAPPPRDPEPLPYLRDAEDRGLDLALQVRLNDELIAEPPFATMYWTAAQQLAHLTVNGAPTRPGDVYGSGTVSGPQAHQRGSLLEITWGGSAPLQLAGGRSRTFLEDGDTVTITADAPGPGGTRIGFGEVCGTIVPAP